MLDTPFDGSQRYDNVSPSGFIRTTAQIAKVDGLQQATDVGIYDSTTQG